MARLVSIATDDFTDAAAWGLVDSTSALEVATPSTSTLSSTYNNSSTFTPGAITVEGICIYVMGFANTTGTISVALHTGGATVSGTEVTIDMADIGVQDGTDRSGGWVYFKFASPVTLIAATAYSVKVRNSVGGVNHTVGTNGTSNNWLRMLVTSTTQAPAAGDQLYILGSKTGQGTGSNVTITMNNTASTDFGQGTAGFPAICVGHGGTLTFGTTASTNYLLRLSGNLEVFNGGTLNVGTTGTRMPSNSTAIIEFDGASDGDYGLILRGGTTNMQGHNIATTKTVLTADVSASATTLPVGSTSGWENGKDIVIAPTTRTSSQVEKKTITTVDNSTQVTIPALTNARGGVSPIIADVIYLYRNVQVRSVTSTIMAYVNVKRNAVVDIDYVEFYYLGVNTTDKRGIEINTNTAGAGDFDMQNCSLHDFENMGFYITSPSGNADKFTFSNNVCYALNTAIASNTGAIYFGTGNVGTDQEINGNVLLGCSAPTTSSPFNSLVYPNSVLPNVNNNVIAGCSAYAALGFNSNNSQSFEQTFTGNKIYSNNGKGITINSFPLSGAKFVDTQVFRNNSEGINIGDNATSVYGPIRFDNLVAFGNANANITIEGGCELLEIRNSEIRSDASFTTGYGIQPSSSGGFAEVYIFDTTFGNISGHTSGDIYAGQETFWLRVHAFNTTFQSTTEFATRTSCNINSFLKTTKHDQTGTNHQMQTRNGIVASETTVRHTASGLAWKMTPNQTLHLPLTLPGPSRYDAMRAAVVANEQVTISAWVRKDSSYNGSFEPRLKLLGEFIAGINSDVVDSLTVGADTWEELQVQGTPTEDGVIEFVVECIGNAGNVYVDDITISQA